MTYFVDTNVLVYARDSSEASKQLRAADWLGYLWQSQTGRLSMQVLQEYYQTVTRRLRPGMPRETARADVRDLMSWRPVAIDAAVIEKAWSVEERYGFSWWDSLIVASALQAHCDYLLSEDLQHEQELDGIVALNPFRAPVPTS